MSTDHITKPDISEIVQIGDHLVDLSTVSPELRSQYHRASQRVSRHQGAQAAMASVCQAILDEQATAAIKACKPIRGDREVFKALAKIKR
jgi:3-deoxy-D-manno-octulosonate 8-phosphate phosphatase KdsC-like HAD superfamily phosphatase